MDFQQGTLALMVRQTLDLPGPLHGNGIAPENHRRARFYRRTRDGRRQLQATAIVARFLEVEAERLS